MDPLLLSLLFLSFVVLIYILRSVHVIPARRWALQEQLGSFQKLLMPGIHFVWWPFQSLRTFEWSYSGQQGQTVHLKFQIANFDAVQMDLPPVKCITKDQIQVTVDATMTYRVSDLRLAGYETSDPLNLLFQTATQAIRNTIADLSAGELNGKDEFVAAKVVEYINRLMSKPDRGVRCDLFNVQSISMDKRILEANQKIYATKAQQEMLLQQKLAEHELATQSLRMRSEQQRAEHALALAEEKAKQELAAVATEEEARRKNILWNVYYKNAGFSTKDMLEIERLKILEGSQTTSKIVYAPIEYWAAARRLEEK